MSSNLFLLVFEQVLSLDIDICLLESCNCLELCVTILLVEIHAVWEHLLEITNSEWVPRGEQGAVNFESCWVSIVEAPDPDVVDEEAEVSACLEVERLVFLYGSNRHSEQVWSTNDVPLKFHEVRIFRLHMVVNVLNSTSDLFFSLRVNGVPGSNLSVINSRDFVWRVPWEDQVNVIVFLSTLDDSGHQLFADALLECVCLFPHPYWV